MTLISTRPTTTTSAVVMGAFAFGFGLGWLMAETKKRVWCQLQTWYPGLFISSSSSAGGSAAKDPQRRDQTVAKLLEISNQVIAFSYQDRPAGNCVLASINGESQGPRVRPINPVHYQLNNNDDNDPHVIFFTNRLTRKYQDFQKDARAELNFIDSNGIGYVSLSGTVVELSPEQAKSYWKDRMIHFIAEGPQGSEGRYTVLKLLPTQLELISLRLGLDTVHHESWEPWRLILSNPGTKAAKWIKP